MKESCFWTSQPSSQPSQPTVSTCKAAAAFLAHGHPPTGPQYAHITYCLSFTSVERQACFVSRDRVASILYNLFDSQLCYEAKRQKRNRLFLYCHFFIRVLKGERHMSYCFSGYGGLKMYNTSKHDHFLRLKPLKMAPYFLKPIDLV